MGETLQFQLNSSQELTRCVAQLLFKLLLARCNARPTSPPDRIINNNNNVRTIFGVPLYDKVSSKGRFTPLDIVDAAISFIY